MCLLSPVPPLPSSALLTHPGKIINNYSTSLHWVRYCPVSYNAYSAELSFLALGRVKKIALEQLLPASLD